MSSLDDSAPKCVVMLAGGEAIVGSALALVREFAVATGIGVANTWDAKGLFAWDSPHHLGTCGLQANDFELLGWSTADLIITTGRPDLALGNDFHVGKLSPTTTRLDVEPKELASLVNKIKSATTPNNRLYAQLAAIAQPGYQDERVPLHPARAVANLGRALPTGGLLTAEPGLAGLWVARTFPTPALNDNQPPRVLVPTTRNRDEAITQSLIAAKTSRPTIYVLASPPSASTQSLLETAISSKLNLIVNIWTNEKSDLVRGQDHYEELARAIAAGGVHVVKTPIDFSCTNDLIAAAGAITAWGGLLPAETVLIET